MTLFTETPDGWLALDEDRNASLLVDFNYQEYREFSDDAVKHYLQWRLKLQPDNTHVTLDVRP